MENGISIYLGLDNTIEENLQLIKTAYKYGIKRIFTSLHIPETNVNLLQEQLQIVLKRLINTVWKLYLMFHRIPYHY